METLWFCLVAAMLAAYVLLDGFDIGAGIVHHWVARTDEQRRMVLASIGPVWDGNEVWLLAAGGTLYFAFPAVYASSFSGFYLPLMIVLWLLILRGVSVEFRSHIDSPVWKPFWDFGFTAASVLLAVFFGAALGNVLRGAPLEANGTFFVPLWTDLGVDGELGVLDWYTILVGVLALVTLAQHGALWVAMKTAGQIRERAARLASALWFAAVILAVAVTALTMRVQPQVRSNLAARPWGYVFPALAVAGLILTLTRGEGPRERLAFLGSCLFIGGMLSSAAFGLYPYLLPARPDPARGLTVYNTATSAYGMKVGLAWWIPGMILALGYFIYAYRRFAGKVRLEGEGY